MYDDVENIWSAGSHPLSAVSFSSCCQSTTAPVIAQHHSVIAPCISPKYHICICPNFKMHLFVIPLLTASDIQQHHRLQHHTRPLQTSPYCLIQYFFQCQIHIDRGCRSPKYLGTNLVTNLSPNLVINLVNHQIW